MTSGLSKQLRMNIRNYRSIFPHLAAAMQLSNNERVSRGDNIEYVFTDSLEAVAPTLFTIGSGGLIGFLAGFAIKRIFKILAVIVGIFFAALMYFQSQNLISVNWDKIQSMSQGMVSTLAHTLTDTGQISTIAGNLGIPLTGGLARICNRCHEGVDLVEFDITLLEGPYESHCLSRTYD